MNIFFITGTSGSGKSTLVEHLRLLLPPDVFEIYDFDQKGAPSNADEIWRQHVTDEWLEQAQENNIQHKSTVICGVTVPAEVLASASKPNLPMYFCCIIISDKVLQERLEKRNWSEKLIQDTSSWGRYLEQEVRQQDRSLIVNSSFLSPAQVAHIVSTWIKKTNLRKNSES